MRAINDGGPVVPHVTLPADLRDYFAAKAVAAILSTLSRGIHPRDLDEIAKDAYVLADAMLAQRDKP